jgi:hypothetical protein
MRKGLFLLLLLCGCNDVLGIPEVSLRKDAGSDAPNIQENASTPCEDPRCEGDLSTTESR